MRFASGLTFLLAIAVLFLTQCKPAPTPPAKTETLSCIRVKQVTPAGTINYLCEVKNGRP